MKKSKVLTGLTAVLILLTLIFIWGNSIKNAVKSTEESKGVLTVATPFLEIFVGKGNVTDHLVRKIAHFIEYDALGCELGLLIVLRKCVRKQPVANCLFGGLSAAVADESLQLFSHGRSSQVSDVLLDFCGAVTGIIFILLLRGIVTIVKKLASHTSPA